MKSLRIIMEKLEDIRNSDFIIDEVNYDNKNYILIIYLEKLYSCYNAITGRNGISKDKKVALKKELEEIMKSKLKEINPIFDVELLNKILYGYKRG